MSCGFCQQQLYYKSPFTSYSTHHHFGEGIVLTVLVLTVASVLVLQFESKSPDANITTGGDSLWYSIVTITTVGYGDFYPVTFWGRVTAMFIMFAGVGIIGALASILASLLVGGSSSAEEEETPAAAPVLSVQEELKAVREELAAMRQMLEKMGGGVSTN